MANTTIRQYRFGSSAIKCSLTQRSNGRIDLFRDGMRVKTYDNLTELIRNLKDEEDWDDD